LQNLKTSIRYLKGIGPAKSKIFSKLGIKTIEDFLTFYPRTYQDRSLLTPIHRLQVGEVQTFVGQVVDYKGKRFQRKGINTTRLILSDGLRNIALLFFNQPHLKEYLPVGQRLVVTGRIRRFGHELQVTNFDYEILSQKEPVDTQRIVPLYPLKEGLSPGTQRLLRRTMHSALDEYLSSIEDPLPFQLISQHRLLDLRNALRTIHFPESFLEMYAARSRLIFNEFFFLMLALGQVKRSRGKMRGIAFRSEGRLISRFIASLPFRLTNAQERVIKVIKTDMALSRPMNRLLHGEVGSGKTVVAICAALLAKEYGYQIALMAPTEILAEQHLLNLKRFLDPLSVRIDLLTSGVKGETRDEILARVARNEIDILIGTHALIQEGVKFGHLGLVIIDEQHRFGVLQRATLFEKAQQGGVYPDLLVMSATPIPRTLALTLYGDLDISFLDELPSGRGKIKTFCRSEKDLPRIYDFMKERIKEDYQAYIVCPLIEANEELGLKAAKEMFEILQSGVFQDLRLGLLHGRMNTAEKTKIMEAFRRREIDILVSTTVIEVGVDIPLATLMLIEHAERFGLSQLHQLRGRIGRGSARSYCILLTTLAISNLVNSEEDVEPLDDELSKAVKRLKTMVGTNDGFKIAEVDLELRGPGEFFGVKQHGMPELKLGHLIRDRRLLELAHQAASLILDEDSTFSNYPLLQKVVKDYLEMRQESSPRD